jgi:hypothetical protein
MTDDTDRPFSRFYAQLLREAGEEVDEADRGPLDSIGVPKLANPRPGSDADN